MFYGTVSVADDQESEQIPDAVYQDLGYVLSLVLDDNDMDPGKVSGLIDFVRTIPAESSFSLETRDNSEGAFHAFDVNSQFFDFLGYSFNPDIPSYVTRPSSLQEHRWLTSEAENGLRNLIAGNGIIEKMLVLRGQESETITPDIHTGGYYTYEQDRIVWILPDAAGPILISATIQDNQSDIGRRGCVVGDDRNWDYLYSSKSGLDKTGLGWVDTFMYKASAVTIYVSDTASGIIRTGTFKWLNAGWSKINMVKFHHILKGIKRYAHDLRNILESPNLPGIPEISDRYQTLLTMKDQDLRLLVEPYLETLKQTESIEKCSNTFVSMVSSGKYLQQMGNQELVRILLLEYLKGRLEGNGYGNVGYRPYPQNAVSQDS